MCTACHAASSASGNIIFLGDDTRIALVANCAEACTPYNKNQIKTPAADSSASDTANLFKNAKYGILVVDAASGALPITREHILIARQAGIPKLSVLFVNTAAFNEFENKSEIMDMEIANIRELLNTYEMQGDTAEVFFEQSGLKSLISKTIPLTPSPSEFLHFSKSNIVTAFIHNLSELESDKTIPIMPNKKEKVWINGHTIKANVLAASTIEPGEAGEIILKFDTPINTTPGLRFFIENDKKIISIGVIVSIVD